MLAKAKYPSAGLSCTLLPIFSLTMHLEMNEELLLAILFFGFLRFPASLVVADNMELPSPNAGAEPMDRVALALPVTDVPPPSLLPGILSAETRSSAGCSCMLPDSPPDRALLFVSTLYSSGAELRELNDSSEILVPAVAG